MHVRKFNILLIPHLLSHRYFAAIHVLDRQFGRILDSLKQSKLDKNTVVVFTSDHGEMLKSHNKMGKNTPFDESSRVPLLIRIPSEDFRDGYRAAIFKRPVSLTDLFPTLVGLTKSNDGRNFKDRYDVDGEDLSQGLLACAANPDQMCGPDPPEEERVIVAGMPSTWRMGVSWNTKVIFAGCDPCKGIKVFDLEKDPAS